jgi:hypothetical protein
MRAGIRTRADLKSRCTVDVDTGCWRWTGARDVNGQPRLWLPALCTVVTLGVAACYIRTGARPEKGQIWHAVCATRECANPAHRAPGTRSSLMLGLGMQRTPLQRAHYSAGRRARDELSEADIEFIRSCGLTLREICARVGISENYARSVRRGLPNQVAAPGSSVFNQRL